MNTKEYFSNLKSCLDAVEVRDQRGNPLPLQKTIDEIARLAIGAAKKGNKVMIIGNGGSASIASHTAIDLLKNAKVPALAFNDPSFLTCLANDLGYESVFSVPVERLSKRGDLFIAISSSGKSKNILNAAKTAKKKNNVVVTLSGFKRNNPLRPLGHINFYVPSNAYGFVEIAHSVLCHWITDQIMQKRMHG